MTFGFCKTQNLKVITFNIRMATESDGDNAWSYRKDEVTDLLNYYHPDIFGVQEALPEQMDHLNSVLSDYNSIGVGRDDGKRKGEYSAIFYDDKKFEVIKSGTFWLSETPEKVSLGWDAACNRVCSYSLLKDKNNGAQFWTFNTHFDHVGNQARKESAKVILAKIKQFNPDNLPVVLTGDFNLTDDSLPMEYLSTHLKDAYSNTLNKPYGPAGTFNDFDTTKPAKDRIDYIFVQGFKVLTYRVINDLRKNLHYPSDHFPVMVQLEFDKE